MDEEQLFELYKLIKRGYDNTCWDTVQESMEIILEYIETEEELEE